MTGGIAHAQGVLRIAMTASDVPLPNGQTDQGAEGMRFIGYTLFDSLVLWDLTSADKPASLTPCLASEWSVDAVRPSRRPSPWPRATWCAVHAPM